MSELLIAGTVRESIVDGPGIRYVVFTQGCPHKCKGCHNPTTHDMCKGKMVDTDNIVDDIKKCRYIDGVTFSGGEPFIQPDGLLDIVKNLYGIHIVCYTGYTFEYIIKYGNRSQKELLRYTDILVDGKYIEELRDLTLAFRGSSNQRLIDVKESLRVGSIVLYDCAGVRNYNEFSVCC